MAEISVIFDGKDDPIILSKILDGIAGVLNEVTGHTPLLGLTVDGDPREPDEPGESVF